MIRNYLGFPRGISGKELASRASEQAMLLGTEMVFIQPAVRLQCVNGEPLVTLANGSQASSRSVVIATA